MGSKKCARCKVEKPSSEFNKARGPKPNKDGLFSWCKRCECDSQREYRKRDPDRYKGYDIVRKKKDPMRHRPHALRRNYGLSVHQYDDMLLAQGGVCAICKTDKPGGPKPGDVGAVFHVDHDHSTNAIRGLLCSWCNRAIGMLKDDPNIIFEAALYVERHKSKSSGDKPGYDTWNVKTGEIK